MAPLINQPSLAMAQGLRLPTPRAVAKSSWSDGKEQAGSWGSEREAWAGREPGGLGGGRPTSYLVRAMRVGPSFPSFRAFVDSMLGSELGLSYPGHLLPSSVSKSKNSHQTRSSYIHVLPNADQRGI